MHSLDYLVEPRYLPAIATIVASVERVFAAKVPRAPAFVQLHPADGPGRVPHAQPHELAPSQVRGRTRQLRSPQLHAREPQGCRSPSRPSTPRFVPVPAHGGGGTSRVLVGIHNIGSTWMGGADTMLSLVQLVLKVLLPPPPPPVVLTCVVEVGEHMLRHEYEGIKAEWSRWWPGVTSMYAQEVLTHYTPTRLNPPSLLLVVDRRQSLIERG